MPDKYDIGSVLEAGLDTLGYGDTPACFYPTGLTRLDGYIIGLTPGMYGLIVGEDGLGKSTIALSAMLHTKTPTTLLSTEDGNDVVASRLLSMVSGVPEKLIRRNSLDARDRRHVMQALELVKRRDIRVYFPHSAESTLRSVEDALKAGTKMLWLDYVQSVASEEAEIAVFLREWKMLLHKYRAAGVLLAQFKKSSKHIDKKTGKRVTAVRDKEDVRGSSLLYQKARFIGVLAKGEHDPNKIFMNLEKLSYDEPVPSLLFTRDAKTGMIEQR